MICCWGIFSAAAGCKFERCDDPEQAQKVPLHLRLTVHGANVDIVEQFALTLSIAQGELVGFCPMPCTQCHRSEPLLAKMNVVGVQRVTQPINRISGLMDEREPPR